MAALFTASIIFLILVVNEFWWRKRNIHNELSRKFVHIAVGSFAATWPFYMSWRQIELLGLAMLVGVAASKYLKVFQTIHSVQRPTWGEVCFAIAIGVIPMITHDKWIYAAAMLQMALADGLAAIIGVHFGRSTSYRVLSHTKSVVGTLTFFVVSLVVLSVILHASNMPFSYVWLVSASLLAAMLENIAILGLDNLLVPLVVALLLIHA